MKKIYLVVFLLLAGSLLAQGRLIQLDYQHFQTDSTDYVTRYVYFPTERQFNVSTPNTRNSTAFESEGSATYRTSDSHSMTVSLDSCLDTSVPTTSDSVYITVQEMAANGALVVNNDISVADSIQAKGSTYTYSFDLKECGKGYVYKIYTPGTTWKTTVIAK